MRDSVGSQLAHVQTFCDLNDADSIEHLALQQVQLRGLRMLANFTSRPE